MGEFNSNEMTGVGWLHSRVIDYNHRPPSTYGTLSTDTPSSTFSPKSANLSQPTKAPLPAQEASHWQSSTTGGEKKENLNDLVDVQLQMLNTNKQPIVEQLPNSGPTKMLKPEQKKSFGIWHHVKSIQDLAAFTQKYNPFVEDDMQDMDISDDESTIENKPRQANAAHIEKAESNEVTLTRENVEVKSGAAFYKGLILYIPPFEQLANTYKGSPAMKMLYSSFEFSFKMPVRIESKPKGNDTNKVDAATVYFQEHIISTGSGWSPHVEACVRALELLSETCYTIQAKEDYFHKCKLLNGDNMKTLNLKKWEAVSQKHPKLLEVTKDSHIQKTFAVFLDFHTSSGEYEDIVCCNLTRQDVNKIKSVVEFFNLSMMPCSLTTNLSKKTTPCVVSIHKYTSAQKLLDILIESGGENDKFRLYPPDTFKDFYKLHQNYWDPALDKPENKNIEELRTTLDDEELQAVVLKPYENTISELFEKNKTLPKKKNEDSKLRKSGDDFMKEKLQIDMAHSKNVAPVERMQLLLKYMEQLQEYGSRVLTSGRSEMIRIYHNAIDNLRKDLDTCRKDIEKEQKKKSVGEIKTEKSRSRKSRSPSSRRRSPVRRRSKSPVKRSYRRNSKNRSTSPKRKLRSRSPRRVDRPRRSPSPRRRPKSKSPRRKSRVPCRDSPTRKTRSPSKRETSPYKRARSPRPQRNTQLSMSEEDHVFVSIFKDQLRRYVDSLRRFRIEIEDTPIERRSTLKFKLKTYKEQLEKFKKKVIENPSELMSYLDEISICHGELKDQNELVAGKPGASDLPQNITPPPWMYTHNFESPSLPASYPLPGPKPEYGARIPPPMGLYSSQGHHDSFIPPY